jgi:cyclopropane fatty-acyl-phospholipid synthase-like methyltransferase
MLTGGFKKTEKNFSKKIEILKTLGVETGSRILDYGASWGYGTWQFKQAGFDASGFEISVPRAEYARKMLNVQVEDDLDKLHGTFDVFLSVHVLEHLAKPTVAFDLARRFLRPGGLFVAYTPNGSEACRRANPKRYHESWGRLHPLYLDDAFYCSQLPDQPKMLASTSYGTQFDLKKIQNWNHRSELMLDLSKNELLAVVIF